MAGNTRRRSPRSPSTSRMRRSALTTRRTETVPKGLTTLIAGPGALARRGPLCFAGCGFARRAARGTGGTGGHGASVPRHHAVASQGPLLAHTPRRVLLTGHTSYDFVSTRP